jgi:hypothetical protein
MSLGVRRLPGGCTARRFASSPEVFDSGAGSRSVSAFRIADLAWRA